MPLAPPASAAVTPPPSSAISPSSSCSSSSKNPGPDPDPGPAPAASSSIDPSATSPSKNSPSPSPSSVPASAPFSGSENKPLDSSDLAVTSSVSSASSSTSPTSASSPQTSLLDHKDSVQLQASLRNKRLEINQDIETFRVRKEAEYREFETSLRAEAKAKEKRTRENVSSRGDNRTASAQAAPAEAGALALALALAPAPAPAPAGSTKQGTSGGSESNSGVQVPLDLGGSNLEDDLKATLRQPQEKVKTQEENNKDSHYYPPFEKELQVAGLFAPAFLPLLDSRYHISLPASPKMADFTTMAASAAGNNTTVDKQDDDALAAAAAAATTLEEPATISTSRYSKDNSPGTPTLPLASSLKSAASSSSLNHSSSDGDGDRIPPKSPKKRVTFHFDDDSYVPSRSSPPKNKVVWKLGIADNNDDGFEEIDDEEEDDEGDLEGVDHAEHVEDVRGGGARGSYYENEEFDDSDLDDDRGTVEQIEDVTMFPPTSSTLSSSILSSHHATPVMPSGGVQNMGERYNGDELVTPSRSLLQLAAAADNGGSNGPMSVDFVSPSTMTQGSISSAKSPFAELSSTKSTGEMSNGTSLPPQPDMNSAQNNNAFNRTDDYDDDGLFDLDETIPDQPEGSPPHRDISPIIAATQLNPTNELVGSSSQNFSLPSSLRAKPFAAAPEKVSPGSSEPLTFGKSPLADSSFSPGSGQPTTRPTSNLSTSFMQTGFTNPRNGRSAPVIASSLPATSHFSAARDNTRFRRRSINKYIPSPPPEEADEAEIPRGGLTASSPVLSPYASSVPMGITPRLDSIRSPPASTSPAAKLSNSTREIPDASPLSGRPSLTTFPESVEALTASPPSTSTSSSQIDSYRRTDRFFSATNASGLTSPYRTKFAQEVAERAMLEGDGGLAESVVGGLDGGTGLDPGSFSLMRSSMMGRSAAASAVGGGGFSLSQRLAMEDGVA